MASLQAILVVGWIAFDIHHRNGLSSAILAGAAILAGRIRFAGLGRAVDVALAEVLGRTGLPIRLCR